MRLLTALTSVRKHLRKFQSQDVFSFLPLRSNHYLLCPITLIHISFPLFFSPLPPRSRNVHLFHHQVLLSFHAIFTLPLSFRSGAYLNRYITFLRCCSDIHLCHFMVISPLKFTHSADICGPFCLVKVKDAFPLDALTIKLFILYSIMS